MPGTVYRLHGKDEMQSAECGMASLRVTMFHAAVLPNGLDGKVQTNQQHDRQGDDTNHGLSPHSFMQDRADDQGTYRRDGHGQFPPPRSLQDRLRQQQANDEELEDIQKGLPQSLALLLRQDHQEGGYHTLQSLSTLLVNSVNSGDT